MPESNVAHQLTEWANALDELLTWCYDSDVDWPWDDDTDEADESIPNAAYQAIHALRRMAERFREGVEGSDRYEQIAQEAHVQAEVQAQVGSVDEPTPNPRASAAGVLEFIQDTAGIDIREVRTNEALTQAIWDRTMEQLAANQVSMRRMPVYAPDGTLSGYANLNAHETAAIEAEHARVDAEMAAQAASEVAAMNAQLQAEHDRIISEITNEQEEGGDQ